MFSLNLPPLIWKAGAALVVVLAVLLWGLDVGVDRERQRTDPKVAAICEAAGSSWAEVDGKGKPLARSKWGRGCLGEVRALLSFKAQALAASAKELEAHRAEQERKTEADQLAAQRDADAQRQAQHNMEKADAAVRDDRVDGDWLRALGELGGLRQPAQAAAGAAVPAPRGAPAR